MKDTRITYSNERIEHEGKVWHVDAKLDRTTGHLIVYRVYGDITDRAALDAAIDAHFVAKFK